MSIPVCIFEDEKYRNFLPLTYMRPTYDLRCGILTIREKVENYYKSSPIILHMRKYLKNSLIEDNKDVTINKFDADKILFLNGRILPSADLLQKIHLEGEDELFISNGDIVAARLSKKMIEQLQKDNNDTLSIFKNLKCNQTEINAYLFEYPWHLIQKNGSEISKDIKLLNPSSVDKNIDGVNLIDEKNIYLESDVDIKPNVVLDASDGPIFIGKGTKILSNTYIAGPVYIGEQSFVKANSQIYHDTSIGPVCKVGGEIENSIIHSYSNKQHEGFLGHAYVGSWVNIGASSNNSDLKNDYGHIKVTIDGNEVNTESQFFGLVIGDHSKCAINTMFNTGTVIGISCNVFGSGFPQKYIPSFSWGGSEGFVEYQLRKAIEVAKVVKSRRNKMMSINDLDLFKNVFDLTQTERKKYLS